jgi:hypothetical protein
MKYHMDGLRYGEALPVGIGHVAVLLVAGKGILNE